MRRATALRMVEHAATLQSQSFRSGPVCYSSMARNVPSQGKRMLAGRMCIHWLTTRPRSKHDLSCAQSRGWGRISEYCQTICCAPLPGPQQHFLMFDIIELATNRSTHNGILTPGFPNVLPASDGAAAVVGFRLALCSQCLRFRGCTHQFYYPGHRLQRGILRHQLDSCL